MQDLVYSSPDAHHTIYTDKNKKIMHQIIIFEQIPDNMGIIGTGLISVVVLISGCKKIVDNIPSGNWMKTRYLKICNDI